MSTISQTNFQDLKLFRRGKVRDVYEVGEYLLIVATDRISAFDAIMPNPIPRKGEVLTQISKFWFERTKSIIPNHVVTTDADNFPEICKPYLADLRDRSMLVVKTEPLPVECVVRGYVTGSGYNEYLKTGSISGVTLAKGLMESERLPRPIFTPTTKAEQGHDQSITFDNVVNLVGEENAEKIRGLSIAVYQLAQKIASEKGILIADTKMEFGLKDGELILIDELLTPDSSRFWPLTQYKPGMKQPSYDKQFLRDYLLSIKWDNNTPPPQLPEEIIRKTSDKYLEALRLLVPRTPAKVKMTEVRPILWTKNLHESVDFYTKVIGFKCDDLNDNWGWASLSRDQIRITLARPDSRTPFDKPAFTGMIYIHTDNIDDLWEQLQDKVRICYPIEDFEYGMRKFTIFDTDGYMLQFGKEIQKQ
jgi:phosphoribosylaminoimidazole-succinocarboxamide synthase